MARSTTVVTSRSAPNTDPISFPVLIYTDALPRSDLRNLHDTAFQQPPDQGKMAQWDFPRPRTSDGDTSKKPPPGVSATFDFKFTVPPDEVVPSSARSDHSAGPYTIGIALGSPGMSDFQESRPPPRFNTSIFTPPSTGQSPPTRKSSKWKKIGGLFKAKNALASPAEQGRPVQRKQSAAKTKPNVNHCKPAQRSSTEEWPKIQVDSKCTTKGSEPSSQRTRKFSFSGKKNVKENAENQGPRLDVNIPDVQMERYSVMFSHVMNKNQRPSLLARRRKTLDNLRVPNSQPFLAAKGHPVPQRRATSPARSSFTLFPTSHPPKAARILDTQKFSRRPSPLTRANTLSVESPSKVSAEPSYAIAHNNSLSSFVPPVIPNLFAERSNTPRSSNTYLPRDKPLPVIQPEPLFTQIQPRKMSPQAIRAAQSAQQEIRSAEQMVDKESRKSENPHKSRPNLTIKTKEEAPPPPPAKDAKEKHPSESSCTTVPPFNPPEEHIELITSPTPLSSNPTPEPPLTDSSPIALVTEPEQVETKEPTEHLPTIEVSTARSISVKRGKRQVLVPIGARIDHFDSNERFVERRALTPRIMDVQYGHRHAVSQELQIESVCSCLP